MKPRVVKPRAMKRWTRFAAVAIVVLFSQELALLAIAESGADAWLRYSALDAQTAKRYDAFPREAVVLGDSLALQTAQQELIRGVAGMLDKQLRPGSGTPSSDAIVLGTFAQVRALTSSLQLPRDVTADGY